MVQMKYIIVLFILSLVFNGCFNEHPETPQPHVPQHVNVSNDTALICAASHEDYSTRTFSYNAEYDSVQWFNDCFTDSYLGNADTLVIPNSFASCLQLRCLVFDAGDTTVITQQLVHCTRFMFFPTGFSVLNDGSNDTWCPIYHSQPGLDTTPYSLYWEIRTTDGLKLYESTVANSAEHGWNGSYNGQLMPRGLYLYYAELSIEGEIPVEYTGWVEMLE